MIGLFCFVLAVLGSPFKSKLRLEAENAVLRHQLIVLRRSLHGRVRLTNHDRWFLIQLYRWFPSILQVLTIIRPETLVLWHRAGFRCYWRWKSRRRGGRPQIETELRALPPQGSHERAIEVAPKKRPHWQASITKTERPRSANLRQMPRGLVCKLRQRGRDYGGRAGSVGIDPSLQPLPIRSNCWGRALWTGGIPDDRKLKPQFRPRLFGLQHRCCVVRGPVLHLRVPYFRPTFTPGRTFGPTEAALFRFMRCAQSSLDCVCGVENRVLLRGRHACFGLTIVQMHGPSPPGWAGCLDDLILDTLVLHAGNNGPREQWFLSGFGLTIRNRPLRKSNEVTRASYRMSLAGQTRKWRAIRGESASPR
jgi:hypothetical protein